MNKEKATLHVIAVNGKAYVLLKWLPVLPSLKPLMMNIRDSTLTLSLLLIQSFIFIHISLWYFFWFLNIVQLYFNFWE